MGQGPRGTEMCSSRLAGLALTIQQGPKPELSASHCLQLSGEGGRVRRPGPGSRQAPCLYNLLGPQCSHQQRCGVGIAALRSEGGCENYGGMGGKAWKLSCQRKRPVDICASFPSHCPVVFGDP